MSEVQPNLRELDVIDPNKDRAKFSSKEKSKVTDSKNKSEASGEININEVNSKGKNEVLAQQQHKDVAGMLEKFVSWADTKGELNSLNAAREAVKYIKNKALGVEFTDKSILEGEEAQKQGFVFTGQEIKINVRDENTGAAVKAEFSLVVDADKTSSNYGKYKLVPVNEDASRLK